MNNNVNNSIVRTTEEAAPELQLPPWMLAIQTALRDSMQPKHLKAIMDAQIQKALDGDEKAARFCFDQATKIASVKGLTIVQNNFYGASSAPNGKTQALPGTDEKLQVMQERLARREPLTRSDDSERGNLE